MKYVITGTFTTLNDYIDAERSSKYAGAEIKETETDAVHWLLKDAEPIPEDAYPICPSFTWYVKDMRTDADNIDFAKKFVLDGMVAAGILKNDNRKHVSGFGPCVILVDKENPRVVVTIESV